MPKKILAVVVGYVAMALFVFISFSVLYAVLGPEGSFEPESYRVTERWIALSALLSMAAAVLGGAVCSALGKTPGPTLALTLLVVVLGVLFALPTLNPPPEVPRGGDVPNLEAMQGARTPAWVAFANPVLGAVGIYLGDRWIRRRRMKAWGR